MRYLLFTNTPAHVHLYKHAARQLLDDGHEVLILARDYGCTIALLDWYDLPYSVYGACETSKGSLFRQLPGHYARIVKQVRAFDPDLIFGMGAYSAHAGAFARTPTILVLDSEPTSIDHAVSRPFADAILTPNTFRKDLGSKHYTFDGFKECAYLHPEVFTPQPDIHERLGIGEAEPYVLLRFNAFGSHHDIGEGGFTAERRRTLIEQLAESATVFVSDEGDDLDVDALPARPYDLHPALMHAALDEAELLVADTQTMVTEAALLGTPAIRSNSFVGEDDMGNFIELEERDLIYNLADFDDVLDRARSILETDGIQETWERRRESYLQEKVNLTALLVDIATNGPPFGQLKDLTSRSDAVAARAARP